jgi:hypothetical protein
MNDGIYSISQYIDCKPNLLTKIQAIDNLISAMELKLVDTVGQVNYSEYSLDDGQMKIRTVYRSPNDVLAGIDALEKLKQRYINRYNGRRTVFRGGQF